MIVGHTLYAVQAIDIRRDLVHRSRAIETDGCDDMVEFRRAELLEHLVAAPEVLIPIQCEYYALEGLEQLIRTVDLVRSHLNPALNISTILLTMYDARTRLASQVADEVRSHFGEIVLKSVVPRSVRVSEAPSYGQSVMTYDPGSSGAVAYLEAAREIAFRGNPNRS